ISTGLEQCGERRHALVEPKARVVVDAVAARQEAREDRCVRGQRERRGRKGVRVAKAGRSEAIDGGRESVVSAEGADTILAERVDRNEQDGGASQRAGTRKA